MPIDPADVGRTYESIIRVNSQSGKGGISYLLEAEYGLALPRRLQVEFSSAVQKVTDDTGKEVTAAEIWSIFEDEYLKSSTPLEYVGHTLFDEAGKQGVKLRIRRFGKEEEISGVGNGPIDAFMKALNVPVQVRHYDEHSLGSGADARAVAFVEVSENDQPGDIFGVGIDPNIITASFKAVVSAANRCAKRHPAEEQKALYSGA